MRTLVSYDDISQPYEQTTRASADSQDEPAAKKRKRNSRKRPKNENSSATGYGDYHTSRDLTHQEIWDDSALVEAWDAATEEYEMHHGPEKAWKTEPLHKSPLWYNIPPESADPDASSREQSEDEEGAYDEAGYAPDVENSNPIQFDNFIPRHDPTLEAGGVSFGESRGTVLSEQELAFDPSNHTGGSIDEAFTRAQAAMYWAGYWTAMYHARKGSVPPSANVPGNVDHPERRKTEEVDQSSAMESTEDAGNDPPTDAENWVSTQR